MSERIQLIGTDKHVYYGKCYDVESEEIKTVTIVNPTGYITEDEIQESQDSNEEIVETNDENEEDILTTDESSRVYLDLNEGDQLLVTFTHGNTVEKPYINLRIVDDNRNIDVTDAYGRIILMSNIEYNCKYMWEAGDVVPFIYTYDEQSQTKYWKFAAVSPASADKFGTVKIADTKEDLREDNSKTAITYNLLNEEIDGKLDELSLGLNPSENENKWVDIRLKRPENGADKILSTISLPQLPSRTSDFINDGSSSTDTKVYLESEESIYFPYGYSPADPIRQGLPQIGAGYIDEDNEKILNYIPSYNGNLYIGEPSQPTIIDGGAIRFLMPENDKIHIGNENDEYADFGAFVLMPNGQYALGTEFKKPVNIASALRVETIVGGNFNGDDVDCKNLSTDTLKIAGENIVKFISDNAPPTAVDTQFINWKEDPQQESAPTANFVVKRVWTSKLTGAANSHYLPISGNNHNDTSSGSHIFCPIPTLEGYTPVGIVGVNVDSVDQSSNGDWASHTRIWECFLGFSESGVTNIAHLAAINTRDKQQSIYLGIDVLYIQNGNWQVDLTPNPATN